MKSILRRKYIMRRKEFYFMLNEQRIDLIDEKLFQLYNQKEEWKRLAIALDIADEIMKGILPKMVILKIILLETL